MNVGSTITRLLGRSPLVAATLYLAVTTLFISVTGLAMLNLTDHVRAVQQTSETLEKLRSRAGRTPPVQASDAKANPFLGGATLTVAAAALLQRVSSAISTAGGTVQSSQVDVTTGGKEGVVTLQINCEVEQIALQKLLFDLETGSPLLFIDQLDVQTPQSTSNNDDRLSQVRVSMNVSGRWQIIK